MFGAPTRAEGHRVGGLASSSFCSVCMDWDGVMHDRRLDTVAGRNMLPLPWHARAWQLDLNASSLVSVRA
jgi:hypothetical protein